MALAYGDEARASTDLPSVGTATEVADVNTSTADERQLIELSDGRQVFIRETSLSYDSKPYIIDPSETSPSASELCGSGTFGNDLFDAVTSIDLAASGKVYAYRYLDLSGNTNLQLTATSSDFSSCSETVLSSIASTEGFTKSYDYTSGKVDIEVDNGTDLDVELADGTTIGTTGSEESNPARCHGTDYVFYHVWNGTTNTEIWVTDGTSTSYVTDGAYPRCNGSTLHFSQHDGTSWDLYEATITFPSTGPVDADGDGYDSTVDCNDSNAAINSAASEVCDGVDNDCDGLTDDADSSVTGQTTYYVDSDMDGYGSSSTMQSCENPGDGYTTTPGDCDDNSAAESTECYVTGESAELTAGQTYMSADGSIVTVPSEVAEGTVVSVEYSGEELTINIPSGAWLSIDIPSGASPANAVIDWGAVNEARAIAGSGRSSYFAGISAGTRATGMIAPPDAPTEATCEDGEQTSLTDSTEYPEQVLIVKADAGAVVSVESDEIPRTPITSSMGMVEVLDAEPCPMEGDDTGIEPGDDTGEDTANGEDSGLIDTDDTNTPKTEKPVENDNPREPEEGCNTAPAAPTGLMGFAAMAMAFVRRRREGTASGWKKAAQALE